MGRPMIPRVMMICENCDKQFLAERRDVGRGRGQYCSRPCADAARSAKARAQKLNRFWSKVARGGPDECWPWRAFTINTGYGLFFVSIERPKVLAHRFAYELNAGPTSLEVCHTCDNPPCCNPRHLFEGTHHENMLDSRKKGRTGNLPSPETTARVVDLLKTGALYREVGASVGLHKTTVGRIADSHGLARRKPAHG